MILSYATSISVAWTAIASYSMMISARNSHPQNNMSAQRLLIVNEVKLNGPVGICYFDQWKWNFEWAVVE